MLERVSFKTLNQHRGYRLWWWTSYIQHLGAEMTIGSTPRCSSSEPRERDPETDAPRDLQPPPQHPSSGRREGRMPPEARHMLRKQALSGDQETLTTRGRPAGAVGSAGQSAELFPAHLALSSGVILSVPAWRTSTLTKTPPT